jgi:RHS repeat-associated protein
MVSFGASWWSEYEDTINQQGNTHILYREGGHRYQFFGSTSVNYTAKMPDHPYRMVRDASTTLAHSILMVDDGRGVTEKYTEIENYSGPYTTDRRLRVVERRWADGYVISIIRDAQNHITSISDNRGQRAEFTWMTQAGSSPQVDVVSSIRIDTNYNGTTLQPDLQIDYAYDFKSAFAYVVFLKSATTTDIATSQVLRKFEYTYNSDIGLPAQLTSIRDGRLNASGAFDYATFSYGTQTTSTGTGKPIATSTEHAGGVDKFTASMDASGNVTVFNPLGRQTTFGITRLNGRLQITGAQGAAGTDVAATSAAASYTPPAGSPVGYVYSRTERNGSVTNYTRDARGLALTVTENATGTSPRTTTYTWHSTLRLPLTKVTEGLKEEYAYTTDGLRTSYSQTDQKVGSPTYNQKRTWTYGYTTLASGLKVLTSVDGPGLVANGITDLTSFTYTASGELATATDPNGLVTTVLARNDQGQPTQIQQADKYVWTFTYDRMGRVLTSAFTPPGQTPAPATFSYDIVGQLTSYTDSLGQVWTFTYSDARRLLKTVSPSGDTATFTYDAAGNVTKTEYSNGAGPVKFWEQTQFDALSRLLKTIGAQGQQWSYAHDVDDNLTGETDPQSFTTGYGFDALDRVTSVVDRESYSTVLGYDAHDRQISFTDPRSIATTFNYNGFGEVLSETSADRGTISYGYDQRGLVTSRTDGRGVTVNYAYDNGGRLTLIDYPAGGIPDQVLTYDLSYGSTPADAQKGKVARISDGVIQTTFGTEPAAPSGIRTTYTAIYPSGRSYAMSDDTNLAGQQVRTIYPSGREVLYQYDLDGRVSRVQLKDGSTTTTLVDQLTYAPNGPLTGMIFGDGSSETRSYDTSYRLTGITDTLGATTLRQVSYGYDARDDLTALTDALTPANSETFGYTPRQSLTSASGPYGSLGFTYDGVGNRLTASTNTGSGTLVDSYSYPATSNRLSGITLGAGGARGYSYDASGNVTAETRPGATYGYTYDSAGRMASFSLGGVTQATYKYDFAGRQAIRTLVTTGQTIHSVFDAQDRRVAEYDEATGALIREYVWLGWEPLAVIEAGQVYFVRADHIGRPVFATNASGTTVWTAAYSPFGGMTASTGLPMAARFPGQWYQAETGLYQNWMRDYDPTTGRYIEADPLGLVDGASVYGYVKQNPGRYTDPRGQAGLQKYGSPHSKFDENEALEFPEWAFLEPSFCERLEWAIEVLSDNTKWRMGDLNPAEKGTQNYKNHVERIKRMVDKLERLLELQRIYCPLQCKPE